ncbi:MAG: response regulator [Phormidium sp. BM_Day4_Bin.17]|nr:response regulator [Phormidium sp. BM_Day4_Bin.17]UCJ12985.1 MAG: response regulator [Phormidium sp. PBR-2020]
MTATVVQHSTATRLIQQLAIQNQDQLTGQLNVSAASGERWSLYFCVGRLIWATNHSHPVRSLRRQLNAYCPEFDFESLAVRESDRFVCWNYQVVWVLLKRNILDKDTAIAIIEQTITDVLFDLFQQERREPLEFETIHHEALSILRMQIVAVNLKQAVKRAKLAFDEWRGAGLAQVSPNLIPVIRNPEELRENVPVKAFEQLRKKINGQRSLRELSILTKIDMTRLTKSLAPYIRKRWIDLVPSQEIEKPELPPPRKKPDAKPGSERKPLIACVDDSPKLCEQLGKIIESAGYEFISITDSVQALPILLEKRPQLIFLDLVMPVANGYEVCTQLRRMSQFAETPIIILTGNDGVVDRVRAKMVKASDFLGKPIDTEKLLATVRKFLQVQVS